MLLVSALQRIDSAICIHILPPCWISLPPTPMPDIQVTTGHQAELPGLIYSRFPLLIGFVHAQPCLALYNPMDCGLPGFSVHGVLQARILEWVSMTYSGDLSDPGIKSTSLMSPASAGGFSTTSCPGKSPSSVQFSSVAPSCPTVGDPMNRSTPGLPVYHQLPEFTQTHVH